MKIIQDKNGNMSILPKDAKLPAPIVISRNIAIPAYEMDEGGQIERPDCLVSFNEGDILVKEGRKLHVFTRKEFDLKFDIKKGELKRKRGQREKKSEEKETKGKWFGSRKDQDD